MRALGVGRRASSRGPARRPPCGGRRPRRERPRPSWPRSVSTASCRPGLRAGSGRRSACSLLQLAPARQVVPGRRRRPARTPPGPRRQRHAPRRPAAGPLNCGDQGLPRGGRRRGDVSGGRVASWRTRLPGLYCHHSDSTAGTRRPGCHLAVHLLGLVADRRHPRDADRADGQRWSRRRAGWRPAAGRAGPLRPGEAWRASPTRARLRGGDGVHGCLWETGPSGPVPVDRQRARPVRPHRPRQRGTTPGRPRRRRRRWCR